MSAAPEPTIETIDPDTFEPETGTGESHYRLDGLRSADWAVRKLAQYRRKVNERRELVAVETKRLADLVEVERSRLSAWLADANEADEASVTYFEALLRNWHDEQLAEDPKAKTIKLPGGELRARRKPGHFVIDEEQFIPWALSNDLSLLRTKYEPIKSEIKDQTRVTEQGVVVDSNGEALPGVEWADGEIAWKAVTE